MVRKLIPNSYVRLTKEGREFYESLADADRNPLLQSYIWYIYLGHITHTDSIILLVGPDSHYGYPEQFFENVPYDDIHSED